MGCVARATSPRSLQSITTSSRNAMKQRLLLTAFILSSITAFAVRFAHTQEREITARPRTSAASAPLIAGRYHALLIGVANYTDPRVNDLDYPLRDVARVKQALTTHYSFAAANVKTLADPTREQILSELQELAGLKPEDHLLIFYAGHGVWNEVNQQGYWLPSDARRAVRSSWISNSDLRDAIVEIPARHTLLISDACFSGGLFVTREAFTREPALEEVDKLRSRTAMTSGALTTVPDRSVFVQYLLDKLERNAAPYLFAQELFAQLRQPVINNSKRQADGSIATPRYGVIQETKDEGGDFIFLRKVLPVAATPLPAPTPSLDPAALEFALWQSADRSNEISEFEEYLRQYPSGRFAVSARNRIARLRAPAANPAPVNPAPVATTLTPLIALPAKVNPAALSVLTFTTASVDANGKVTRFAGTPTQQYVEDLGGGVLLEMVPVKGNGAIKDFWIGKFEVTQTQWRVVVGNDPSWFKGDRLPVENVCWGGSDCPKDLSVEEFIKRLNAKLRLSGASVYRLPKEAEWEYAARAGTKTEFAFGDTINAEIVNYNGNSPYGKAPKGVYREKTVDVGSLGVANVWGIFDMPGNVWEWCEDIYISSTRVVRGGYWEFTAEHCRSAYRGNISPGIHGNGTGFRLVRT